LAQGILGRDANSAYDHLRPYTRFICAVSVDSKFPYNVREPDFVLHMLFD